MLRAPGIFVARIFLVTAIMAVTFLLLGVDRTAAAPEVRLPVRSGAQAAPPNVVMPTIETLDRGAETLRPLVDRNLREIIDLTGDQMGWRPDAPVTIFV